jgi:plastocyanin
MNRNALIGLLLAALIIVGIVVYAQRDNNNTLGTNTENVTPPPTTPPPTTPTTPPTTPPVTPPASSGPVAISIGSSGFSPSAVTVKKGTTVTFTNNDTKARWPASAPHPSHTDYPAFDPKQGIAPTDSWSFTFDKVGIWRYHDHLNPTVFGSVTVTE